MVVRPRMRPRTTSLERSRRSAGGTSRRGSGRGRRGRRTGTGAGRARRRWRCARARGPGARGPASASRRARAGVVGDLVVGDERPRRSRSAPAEDVPTISSGFTSGRNDVTWRRGCRGLARRGASRAVSARWVRRAERISVEQRRRRTSSASRVPVGLTEVSCVTPALPGAVPGPRSRAVVSVRTVASPVTRLPRLTPPSTSRPSPLDVRAAMIAASAGGLAATRDRRSRSYQRKAGMPSLVPWRRPAWLAEGSSTAGHRLPAESLWLPSRTQSAIVLTDPPRIRAAMIG